VLRADEAPNLIALDALAAHVPHSLTVVEWAASATSSKSLVTVLIETSAIRLTERRLAPSTSIWMI